MPMTPRMTRLFGFLSILIVLGASGYTFLGSARVSKLNPISRVSQGEARAELASAQYTLAIVSGQLAQVHTVSGTYADTLDFDKFPLVRLVSADESSYCVEFRKTQTFFLRGPGGVVAPGSC
jgi:hypothetical protein